jgi:hypothetical protein
MKAIVLNADELAAQRYLADVLGESEIKVHRLDAGANLPYYLTDEFRLSKVSLFGRDILLANPREGNGETSINRPMQLRKAMDALQNATGKSAAYLCHALAAYERKRLIEQKVAFIVPGNQLYLPTLFLDLREHSLMPRVRRPSHLTPTTQAFFLTALQLVNEKDPSIAAAAIGRMLQITPTSVTRAVRDLCAADLITDEGTVNRNNYFKLAGTPAEMWKRAQSLLKSPVKRRVWASIQLTKGVLQGPQAGITALGKKTMLSEIGTWTRACTAKEWSKATTMGVIPLPGPHPDAGEWEIWSYPPTLNHDAGEIDLLSHYLSLRDRNDERVQMALDELLQGTPWSLD